MRVESLLTMDLARCQVTSGDLSILSYFLQSDAVSELNLKGNKLGRDPAATALFTDLMAGNRAITALDLSQNKFGEFGSRGGVAAATLLRHNVSLRKVNLSWNDMAPHVGKEFQSALLRPGRALTELNLQGNRMGRHGAVCIGRALERNSTLMKLDLSFNGIDVAGAQSLADALRVNRTLTWLSLANNEIGPDGAHAIAYNLRDNRVLTHLSVVDNKIGDRGASALASFYNAPFTKVLHAVTGGRNF